MSSGLNASNTTIVSAFKSALFHQGLVVLAILALLALAFQVLRIAEIRRALAGGATVTPLGRLGPPEAPARRLLRIGFGLIWLFDGILQGQPDMPLGMTSDVIQPAAAASPSWVQHLDNAGATIWSYHPIAAPASAVWIQVGIGLWLLVASRGSWSRLAGAASVGWGLIVWIFGEAFGGVFAPGLTWLFGAPGAVLFYVFAGALIALPERWWTSPRIGRIVLDVMAAFFVGMAVLQAWPGRGFWQGRIGHPGSLGTLASMTSGMSQTPQPHALASAVSAFTAFDEAHGFAVNLFVVIALAGLGLAFASRRTVVLRYAMVAAVVLCLADWVLIEDFGFFGGVGTDPNSMIPMSLVLLGGYLGVSRVPATVVAEVPIPADLPDATSWSARLAAWSASLRHQPSYLLRSLAALGALGVVLVGVVPMAFAATDPNADPIIAQATDGTPDFTNFAAANFHLVDQRGVPTTLASFKGRTVALTFLDPVCTSDCPIIAQEFRETDEMLGATSKRVDFVAIVANPLYRAVSYVDAFDRQEGLEHVANWRYLTGNAAELAHVWSAYGVQVAYESGGAMIAHTELSYVIDGHGRIRAALDTDAGPGTTASESSFAVTLADAIRRVTPS